MNLITTTTLEDTRYAARERQRRRRQQLRTEERDNIRLQRRNILRQQMNDIIEQDRQLYLQNERARQRQRRSNMGEEDRQIYLQNERARQRERRNNMNEAERQNIPYYFVGDMSLICSFCRALRFRGEALNCCQKGKVSLPPLQDYPPQLQRLLEGNDQEAFNFRSNIRNYNSSFSFASFGANIVRPPGRGPYCFRLQGQTYHYSSTLHPNNEEERKYGQIYILDSSEANQLRCNLPENNKCIQSVFETIATVMENNPYAQAYKNMRAIELEEEARAIRENVKPRRVSMHFTTGPDIKRFNNPINNEIGVVFVGEDGAPPANRDIIVYPHSQPKHRISYLSCHLDPMIYPILFPNGEQGWHINMQHRPERQTRIRNKVTMQEYYSYRLAIRDSFSIIHRSGKLFQQYVVDAYVKVEGCRLNFIKSHQSQLRAAQYSGLMDHLARNEDGDLGVPVILPSSFTGSPRNLQQLYQDAMAVFCKYGKPDLFLTYTCNPRCPEILNNLGSSELAQNRPDLISRVYHAHLTELLKDIKDRHVLGTPVAYVYVIEFQKRGLPHCHMIIMLRDQDKIRTVQQIDAIVSAEIPGPEDPELRDLVKSLMVHGPCGTVNPNSPCMSKGLCQKNFPKAFREETVENIDGYPAYKRANNGDSVQVGNFTVDNRYIVPFNKFLLRKYRAHINLEICSSVKSIKYIFKYVYKGHDSAMMEVNNHDSSINIDQGETMRSEQRDEVKQYLSCRYVSPPEAMWRLSDYKMHGQSHVVYRLAVHMPGEQHIYYQHGQAEQAIQQAQQRHTNLTAWFELNQNDITANQYFYCDIPHHYVFNKTTTKWTKRKRSSNLITRMYSVSPNQGEKFYLRILLLHVSGAKSFEDLRTVHGHTFPTFREACISLRLLQDDTELENALTEAATFRMPQQLRSMFAMLCLYHHPVDAFQLFINHKQSMIEDLISAYDESICENIALHLIKAIFIEHGSSCQAMGLPEPTGDPPIDNMTRNTNIPNVELLNNEQLEVFNTIIKVVMATEKEAPHNNCFYLDAPGGSGKTFLFNMLYDYFTSSSTVTATAAWTGIAAMLLTSGKTLHSIFKLPVPLTETSVCNVSPVSEHASFLRRVKVFIIDEASMIPNHALLAIDRCLQDIMGNNNIFGGKFLILGGDFRQILPVVPHGSPTSIIDTCLKRCTLWHHFSQLQLTQNVRTNINEQEFCRWLLHLGNGTLTSSLNDVPVDAIDVPDDSVCNGSLISEIFDCSPQEMENRIIMTPKNTECLTVNEEILNNLPGGINTYLSTDYISDDDAELQNYPIEFINSLTPSGMPPHRLNVKIGAIVMLLRNLSINQGLCNGTRMKIKECHQNSIIAILINGSNRGSTVIIPRIKLKPSDTNVPFAFHRIQFPIRLAYSLTINKAQGQTFDKVGIYLQEPVFSHGQLYVACSRARSKHSVKFKVIQLQRDHNQGRKRGVTYTKNIVYREVL